MKNAASKFLFLSGVVIIALSFLTCSKQYRFKYVTYDGRVVDSLGNPVNRVSIVLKACGGGSGDQASCQSGQFTVGNSTTDGNGKFHMRERAARSDSYFVTYNYGGKTF